ncbi:hypothetical protein COO60DRAFT_1650178 [Scenedesmus sp. NREL 46B-D3]|nr:hypothetical protein COO60DRAFT_1650178 [Scenedesmus sp. NREL 46B-D3]
MEGGAVVGKPIYIWRNHLGSKMPVGQLVAATSSSLSSSIGSMSGLPQGSVPSSSSGLGSSRSGSLAGRQEGSVSFRQWPQPAWGSRHKVGPPRPWRAAQRSPQQQQGQQQCRSSGSGFTPRPGRGIELCAA